MSVASKSATRGALVILTSKNVTTYDPYHGKNSNNTNQK